MKIYENCLHPVQETRYRFILTYQSIYKDLHPEIQLTSAEFAALIPPLRSVRALKITHTHIQSTKNDKTNTTTRVYTINQNCTPRKLTWQSKTHHLKMYFLLNMGIFQRHFSFQGCNKNRPPKKPFDPTKIWRELKLERLNVSQQKPPGPRTEKKSMKPNSNPMTPALEVVSNISNPSAVFWYLLPPIFVWECSHSSIAPCNRVSSVQNKAWWWSMSCRKSCKEPTRNQHSNLQL